MNIRQIVSIGSVAAGLMCTGGYAQASESAQGVNPSGAVLPAPGSTGGGSTGGGLNRGNSSLSPFLGVVDLSAPGGTRDTGKSSEANMNAGKGGQAGTSDNLTQQGMEQNVEKKTSGDGAAIAAEDLKAKGLEKSSKEVSDKRSDADMKKPPQAGSGQAGTRDAVNEGSNKDLKTLQQQDSGTTTPGQPSRSK